MTDTPDLHTLAAEALYAAPDEECGTWHGIVRVVLAAVLPAHRRQVLAGAAEVLARDALCNEDTRYDSLAGAAVVVRRLASVAPETAPTPRHGDETAPAVPEATPEPAESDTAGRADAHPLMLRLGNWCCGCGWYAGSADGREAMAEHAAHVAASLGTATDPKAGDDGR